MNTFKEKISKLDNLITEIEIKLNAKIDLIIISKNK